MVQFTWLQPPPAHFRNDFLFSDVRNALWKAMTTQQLTSGIAVADTFTIYGLIFTVTSIESYVQYELTDNFGRAWTIPTWPWTAAGT